MQERTRVLDPRLLFAFYHVDSDTARSLDGYFSYLNRLRSLIVVLGFITTWRLGSQHFNTEKLTYHVILVIIIIVVVVVVVRLN